MSNTGVRQYGRRNLPRGMEAAIRVQSEDVADYALNGRKFTDRHQYIKFRNQPTGILNGSTGAVAAGTTGATNLLNFGVGGFLECHIKGAGQTLILPTIATDGLLVSHDLTNDEGAEYYAGLTSRCPTAFTVGTDPAFFFRLKFKIADVSGSDQCSVGFTKNGARQTALGSYTDFAVLNMISGDIKIQTRLNSGSVTTTDTTQDWADGETHELKVLVSAAGVVTYQIDSAAPTATAAFTFDSTDIVVPSFFYLHDATSPGAVHLDYWEAGFQAGVG